MKRAVSIGLRVAFAVAGLAYIAWSLDWELEPGIVTTVVAADLWLLVLGLVLFAPMFPIAAGRWWMLLRVRGFAVTGRSAFELTMVGNFFNFCLPGAVSGDVAKAWYAAKGTDRRLDAAATVVVDRLTGLTGLALLAGIAGAWHLDDPLGRRLTFAVWGGLAVLLVVGALWASRRARKALAPILGRLPRPGFVGRVDSLAVSGATAVTGYALGMNVPVALALTVIPILYLAAAVPLTYQGLGVMEAVAFALMPATVSPNEIVGMLMICRVYRVLYASIGAVYVSLGRVHLEDPQPVDTHLRQARSRAGD
jgi:uncharacterized membrane protein YbhN (UPF0104 family)